MVRAISADVRWEGDLDMEVIIHPKINSGIQRKLQSEVWNPCPYEEVNRHLFFSQYYSFDLRRLSVFSSCCNSTSAPCYVNSACNNLQGHGVAISWNFVFSQHPSSNITHTSRSVDSLSVEFLNVYPCKIKLTSY